MNEMLQMDLVGKKVMDFGTGTGILAILAQKLGAAEVWSVDYDPQCVENAAENFELNGTKNIHLALGNITVFSGIRYDIVIGNITRNVILEFLSDIAKSLTNNGLFIASGFYEEDLDILKEHAEPLGLRFEKSNTKDKWCTAIFMKK
jgi:ribosomal protein L11 methyltransferase